MSIVGIRFLIGHICPEAQVGGPIALIKTGDLIRINAEKLSINVELDEAEFNMRRQQWKPQPLKTSPGYLRRYIVNVQDASHGCVCDPVDQLNQMML